MSTNQMVSPIATFYKWEKSQPNKQFFNQPFNGQDLTWTYKEAAHEIRCIAAALKAKNLPPHSKIGLVSKNCSYWMMCDLAIMMAGHVSVPIYPNVKDLNLNYVLQHSEAKMLFVGKLDNWPGMADGVPDHVECISFPKYGPKKFTQWEDLVKNTEPLSGEPDVNLDDIMTIIYTSGTTGRPKGVVHTFRSLVFAVSNALSVVDLGGTNARVFSYLPLSHIAERMLVEMGGIYNGGTVFFAESLDTFAKNLAAAKPTVFLGVPRIWTKFQMGILAKLPQKKMNMLLKIPIVSGLIKKKIKTGLGLQDAKHYLTGAAPTPPSLIHWYNKLDIPLQEVYGMTENSAYSHYNRKENVRVGSAGQPFPKVDVIIDDQGEILIKSEANMKGYFKEPELTKAAFRDGYLCTGDAGHVDKDGFLFITGRVKAIFKTAKAKYVAPEPIESMLSANTNIEQVCVSGSNLPQPIALAVLSETAQKEPIAEIIASIKETLESTNKKLEKHEKLCKCVILKEDWTPENEMLTPTMKVKRRSIDKKYMQYFEAWYEKDGSVISE